MNQTTLKIEQLLKLSKQVTFNEQIISGFAHLKENADVILIEEFNDNNLKDLNFTAKQYRFKIDDTVQYEIALHHNGTHFASYENFILHKFDLTRSDKLNKPFVIYEEIFSVSNGEKPISLVLNLFSQFIRCLSERYYYRDNQIIFFSKTHCEVLIQPRRYKDYIDLAKIYNDLKLSDTLEVFIKWLSTDAPKNDDGLNQVLATHQTERYAIAATEFVDHLITFNKNEKLFMLLKNIDDIYKAIISKYSLYLEDFKYSKFTDKITEHSDVFLNKINKIISDLQAQILAVPLAVSFITVFKKAEEINQFVYSGFIVYLIIVFYSCIQQAYNLKHIELQIQKFNVVAKLPTELFAQWEQEITPIKKKLLLHKVFFVFISLFIGILIGICISHITIFNSFNAYDCIYILIFTLCFFSFHRLYK